MAGCGWLGAAVARACLGRGDRVTAVRRDPSRAEALRALGAEPLALDLAEPGSAERLPPGIEAMVACQAAGAEGVELYRRAYLEANRTLVAAARRAGARAFVYTSSTGVFGQRDGGDVDEATAPAPAGAAAEVLLEAERLVLAASASRLRACVVRLSGLYGPGRAGILDRVRRGALALGPGDEAWMNFCHLDDAVSAVLAALGRGRPGGVYHATDAAPARRREVVEWIAARLGIPPPRSQGAAGAPGGANRRVLGDRTRAELGLALSYPSFREGLATLAGG
ncbi:MAG TPA: NAD-dependent epimerase/dehydratase family protein [Anaeromyxobacteraceae bacterium]|nr:NAD-dependent epimerase/dehydratase family protein [Anaeromyxobacteraceae bacterium]